MARHLSPAEQHLVALAVKLNLAKTIVATQMVEAIT